jgi:hypothetical protein
VAPTSSSLPSTRSSHDHIRSNPARPERRRPPR